MARWQKDEDRWKIGAIEAFSNIDPETKNPYEPELQPSLLVTSNIGDEEGETQELKLVIKEQMNLRAPEKSQPEALEIIRETIQSVGKTGNEDETFGV